MTYVNNKSTIIITCKNCYSENRVIRAKKVLAMCGKCGWRLIPPSTEAINFFVITLTRLSGRLHDLRRILAASSTDVDKFERELNTCHALLESLYTHATRHNISLQSYFLELSDIEFLSSTIKDEIVLKTQQATLKRARWKKALNATIKVVNFVLVILQLPAPLHPLPEGSEPRLLEDGSRKRRNR